MEGEVKEIQMELAAIKRDRMDLFTRKQSKGVESVRAIDPEDVLKLGTTNTSNEENYSKFPEIAKLREELIRAKNAADEERFQREKYEAKLKDLELKLNNICCSGMIAEIKETKKHSDEEMTVLKTQVRDMREETEELKITLVEKTEQLQEYRMKMQFQEKLQELAPLPDLLKGAQIQLQEAKQLQRLAEDSSQQLSNELHRVKEKLVVAVNNLNQEKVEKTKLVDENKLLKAALEDKTREIEEMSKSLDDYKCKSLRVEEKLTQQEIRYKEKANECAQLLKDLEEMRIESSRSLGRCKERADSMRRYLQTQISELERQLIQSRAHCRACQKERDEIRQRMQIQINNLQENFELVEIRLRALQNQVTSLKNSYTVILADNEEITELNKITT